MRATLIFLSPVTLNLEQWIDWREATPSAQSGQSIGCGAALDALTRHDDGSNDWRGALAEVFVKSRQNEGVLAALPKTTAALADHMRAAFPAEAEIEAWACVIASQHDGPCLVFAIHIHAAEQAFSELDPKTVRAAFDACAFNGALPWREDLEALALSVPTSGPSAEATHLVSFLYGVEAPPAPFLRAHAEEEGGAANVAEALGAGELGLHYCRPGYSYSTLSGDEGSPILFLLPLIVRAQTVWNQLNGFRGALLDAARARRVQNSVDDADAAVFFERVRFDFELWRVELDGFESALRPWQRALFQFYERDWSLGRSRGLVSDGLARLGGLLEARLRRAGLRAETTQSRVLFILAVLQVIGLVGVLGSYVDLLDRGGVSAATILGAPHYLLVLAGFFAVTALISAGLAIAARVGAGKDTPRT